MKVMTLNPGDSVVDHENTDWTTMSFKPRLFFLDDVLRRDRNFGSPRTIGNIVIVTSEDFLDPVSGSWEMPYSEALRQREKPSELVFHGANIEDLLAVVGNGGIMSGKSTSGNFFTSHYLEKEYHENPDFGNKAVEKPKDPSYAYAKLGKYSSLIKEFVPVTLRFFKDQLPELDHDSSRLDSGEPDHYHTDEDVTLSALTMASKCDLLLTYHTYKKRLEEKIELKDYRKLAQALGFNDKNFYVIANF